MLTRWPGSVTSLIAQPGRDPLVTWAVNEAIHEEKMAPAQGFERTTDRLTADGFENSAEHGIG